MNIYKLFFLLLLVFTQVNAVFAGPGGQIAKSLFTTFWGRVFLFALLILLAPVIIYIKTKEYFASKATQRAINKLGTKHRQIFDPIRLNNRVKDVFTRVHNSWGLEDLDDCDEYMTSWYRQNQQIVYLDTWKRENLENVSRIKEILSVKPLYINVNPEDDFSDTRIVYAIIANMEDYLRERDTHRVVEGKPGFNEVEAVWTFVYENDTWKVDNIEAGSFSLAYAKLKNYVPEIALSARSKSAEVQQ